MRIAIIGLGEAGATYAAALVAAGHQVVACDPTPAATPPGVERAANVAECVTDADAVLVLTGASAAPAVAAQAQGSLAANAVYADFTSSSPNVMAQLAEQLQQDNVRFVDVAILGPVPLFGARVPLMVAGTGGEELAEILKPLGAKVDVLDGAPGAAMAHKLLRSVFMKGLASVVCEAVAAGQAAGYEQWIRGQIAELIAGDGQAVIDRFLSGTRTHAVRRAQEMADTGAYLADLQVPSEMTAATERSLRRLAEESQRQADPKSNGVLQHATENVS
jgi:3-hydroxyisobutyrate dehydrogenase-like beta-hydroxyacid dehydrogenase